MKQRLDSKIGGDDQLFIESNQHPDCLSFRSVVSWDDGEHDELIHICDWPAFKEAVDSFQRSRGGKV